VQSASTAMLGRNAFDFVLWDSKIFLRFEPLTLS